MSKLTNLDQKLFELIDGMIEARENINTFWTDERDVDEAMIILRDCLKKLYEGCMVATAHVDSYLFYRKENRR